MRRFRLLVLLVVAVLLLPNIPVSIARAATVPANDKIGNAKVISSFPFADTQKITGASVGSEDKNSQCLRAKTVWYVFTAPKTQAYSFNTKGSNYDTLLIVFDGEPQPNDSNRIICEDNIDRGPFEEPYSYQSFATVALKKGHTYYIAVSSWGTGGTLKFGAKGPFAISASITGYDADGNSVQTNAGVPEADMSVWVEGFTTNGEFRIYYIRGGQKILFPYGYGAVDLDGTGGRGIFVPQIPKGTYTVKVEEGWIVKTLQLKVLPHLGFSWHTRARGASVVLTVDGFAPKETVVVQWWDGHSWRAVTKTLTTSADGVVEKSITVPSWAPLGTAKVRAIGSKNSVKGDAFEVTAGAAAASVPSPTKTATPKPVKTAVAVTPTSTPSPAATTELTQEPTEIATEAPTGAPTVETTATEAPTPEPTATTEPAPEVPAEEATVADEPAPVETDSPPDAEGTPGA